jgi:hypothetical protein
MEPSYPVTLFPFIKTNVCKERQLPTKVFKREDKMDQAGHTKPDIWTEMDKEQKRKTR